MVACCLSGGVRIPGLIKHLKIHIMCWTSEVLEVQNSGNSKVPIVKVLRMYTDSNKLSAYYRGVPYTLNKEYEATILPHFDGLSFEINEGLHCYSDSCKFVSFRTGIHAFLPKNICSITYNDGRSIDFEGIHPYKVVVVEGYIPPNTRFYINEFEEIVTSKLVLTKILDII